MIKASPPPSYDPTKKKTTLSYSSITYKSGWEATKLTEKTGDCRRAILFTNVNRLGYNYPVIAVNETANTITVKGDATQYLYPPTSFAVIYGQYVKDFIDVSGTSKPVKFFDQVGPKSFADGDGTYDGVCEVCHTRTDHYRNADYAGSAPDQHHTIIGNADGKKCTTCHLHTQGFAGESAGGITCEGCHSDLWEAMNGTTGYHHYMNNASASYATIPQDVNMGGTSDAKRNCLMCHVDHDIFRPDINKTNGARAKNLRASISVTPSAGNTTTYSNTDFNNAQTQGGICISCHTTGQTKSYSQTDSTTNTPTIEKAKFAQSVHNYNVISTFGRDNSTFNANCSKCHNDTLNPKSRVNQLTNNQFGNHQSSLRRVTATLGITLPEDPFEADPLEEDFCYRCHSRVSNANPGGGPAKTTAGKDYYGAANMRASSENIFDISQGTTSTDTLFLRYGMGVVTVDEPAPDASASTDSFQPDGPFGRYRWWITEMLPSKGDDGAGTAVRIGETGQAFWHMPSFISPQVASTTSIPAGTWRLRLWAKEDADNIDAYIRATIYVWTAEDVKGAVILPPTTYPEEIDYTTLKAYDWDVEGASATLNPGDRIVVELEIESRRETYPSGPYCCSDCCVYYYWDSSTYNSKVVMPVTVTFMPKGSFMNTLFPSSSVPLEPDEPAPNDSGSTDTFVGGTWQVIEMSDKHGTKGIGHQVIFSDAGNPAFWKMISFVSQPVPAITSIPAGTWTLHLYASESSIDAHAYMRATIYVWTASDTKGAVILSPTTCQDEITADIAFGVPAYDWDVTGNETTLNPGDKIVIELEIESRGAANSTAATYYWGDEAYYGTKFTMPKSLLFMPKVSGHKFAKYSGLHKVLPAGESRTYMIENRHVECGDCHNPHAADSTLHTPPGNAVSGPLKSVWGVGTDTNPLWNPVTTFTEYKPPTYPDGASTEFQICIKCHSYYALRDADPDKDGVSNIMGPSGVYITDQAMEFSKGNKSAHPVKSTLNNMTGNYVPKGLGMGEPWDNIGDQKMYCTDCHEPHGSTTKFSLKGPNKYWPTDSSGYLWALPVDDSTSKGLFCLNCHAVANANNVHTIHAGFDKGRCVKCHIVVPHGSLQSRLIGNYYLPVPYNYELYFYNRNGILGFRKAAPYESYTMDNCYTSSDASCGGHGGPDCGGLGCDLDYQ